jgi:hypothetical protein
MTGRVSVQFEELFRPRLDVHYLARHHGELLDEAEPARLVMVLTVRASRGIVLYDKVRERACYDVLVPVLPVQVPVQVIA